jgi:hypothetical protein
LVETPTPPDDRNDPAALALGRKGGLKGGTHARKRRRKIRR